MADPIGVASGLLAICTFTFASSVSLYQVIESFQNNKRNIRELKDELAALDGVLQSLQEAVSSGIADFSPLRLPLLRCGQACQEFEALIVKCTRNSNGAKTSFTDWAKLKYMGNDITGFKNMLAGYKSTISIAIGDVNLRKANINAEILKEYQTLITNTTSDLEDHLQKIDERLEALSSRGALVSEDDAAERQQVQEERDSTEQCLAICTQVLQQVDRLRPTVYEDISTAENVHDVMVTTVEGLPSAKRVTSDVLGQVNDKLTRTTSDLKARLDTMNKVLQTRSSAGARRTPDTEAERKHIEEDIATVKQCLAICAQAFEKTGQVRTDCFEDVVAGRNADQLIVSTLGDLLSAKRIKADVDSRQWVGKMTDESLQSCREIGLRYLVALIRERLSRRVVCRRSLQTSMEQDTSSALVGVKRVRLQLVRSSRIESS